MLKKKLIDWERIFLDTSILIDYLTGGHASDETIDKRRKFVVRLIDQLASKRTQNNKVRTFLISSISIGELKKLKRRGKYLDVEIVKTLKTENVEFVPFDNEAAEYMSNSFYAALDQMQQNEFVREIMMGTRRDFALARKWTTIDLMVASCGAVPSAKTDVLLSTDQNSFGVLCDRLRLFHVLVQKENFITSQNENLIFGLK